MNIKVLCRHFISQEVVRAEKEILQMGKYRRRMLCGALVRNMVLSVSQSSAQLRSPGKKGSSHPSSSACCRPERI